MRQLAFKKQSNYSKDMLNKLFPYSVGEDIANSVSHIIGAVFFFFGTLYLMWVAGRYGTLVDTISFLVFGLSLVLMFTMSSIYHFMIYHKPRDVFKRLDHISVYILILGTYTPFMFSVIGTKASHILYFSLVGVAILGIIFKSLWVSKFKIATTFIYILMGWGIIFIIPQVIEKLPQGGLYWLFAGGVIYTLGAFIYALGKFKYHHLVWHIFVILGALAHYISVAFYIL